MYMCILFIYMHRCCTNIKYDEFTKGVDKSGYFFDIGR